MCIKRCDSPKMVCANPDCGRYICKCTNDGSCEIDGHYCYEGFSFCTECFSSLRDFERREVVKKIHSAASTQSDD